LIKVTVAAGTARRWDPSPCRGSGRRALRIGGVIANAKTSKKITAGKMLRKHDERLCRNCALSFMNSPCAAKILWSPILRGCCAPETLHNPVNLEKAGPSVKQKEFIRPSAARKSSRTLRISEVARRVGFSSSALRAWEPWAWSLPLRTQSRYRLFTESDVRLLQRPFSCAAPAAESRAIVHVSSAREFVLFSREKLTASRSAFPQIADSPRPFAGAGRSRHRVSIGFLSALERGQMRSSIATLRRIARFYRTNILSLFETAAIIHAGAPPSTENP